MNPDRLTQKSQEALHDAQSLALRLGHTEVDSEHLLVALIDQADGLVPRLLAHVGADVAALRASSGAGPGQSPSGVWTGGGPRTGLRDPTAVAPVRFGRARGRTDG